MENLSGIYKITNTVNNKYYIGSTSNFNRRIRDHFKWLKSGKHPNKYLQASFNKYGHKSFIYSLVEIVEDRKLLYTIEQKYLDSIEDWDKVYNQSKIANSGGGDTTGKEVYLLDLKGNIIKKFTSVLKLTQYLGIGRYGYNRINTKAICKKQYRVVYKDFYHNNLDIIKSWRTYSCEVTERSRKYWENKYKIITKEGEEICFPHLKFVADYIGTTSENVRIQLLRAENLGLKGFKHKKSCVYITKLKKN